MNKYKWINGSIWYAVFTLLCFIPVWATSNSVLLKTVTLVSLVWCVYLWILQASHYTIPNIFKLSVFKPVLKDHHLLVSFLLFNEDLDTVSKTIYLNIRLAQGEHSDGYDIERFIKGNCLGVNEKFNCITSVSALPNNLKVNINMQIVNGFVFGMGVVASIALVSIIIGLVK